MTTYVNNYSFQKPRLINEEEYKYLKLKAEPMFEDIDSPFLAVLKKFHIEFVFTVLILLAIFPLVIVVYIANGLEDLEIMKYYKASKDKYKYYNDMTFKINRSRNYNDFLSMINV